MCSQTVAESNASSVSFSTREKNSTSQLGQSGSPNFSSEGQLTPRGSKATVLFHELLAPLPKDGQLAVSLIMMRDMEECNFDQAEADRLAAGGSNYPFRASFRAIAVSAAHENVRVFHSEFDHLLKPFYLVILFLPTQTEAMNARVIGFFEVGSKADLERKVREAQKKLHV